MEHEAKSRWPMLLFVATVLSGALSTTVTLYYYHLTTSLQDQERAIVDKQAQYKAEIEDLRKRVVTTQTITQTIATPVVTTRRQCTSILGINNICTDIPESRIEQRQIQTTVPTEDPKIKEQLEAKLKELQDLSATAVVTQQSQVDLAGLVKTVRDLVAPIITLLVGLASLFIILSKKYKAESEKWAFGTLGTILGFWLK